MIISLHFENLFCNIGVMFLCRFAAEGMTLGKDEKRVKQVMTIPIDDNGEEDLYSHLSDIIHFIGKKRESGRKAIIHTFPTGSVLSS